jgi:hypothetical protein
LQLRLSLDAGSEADDAFGDSVEAAQNKRGSRELNHMTGAATMVEKAKAWAILLPAWIPICVTILGAAVWIGQYTQSIDDRLSSLEKQMVEIQDYVRHEHPKREGGTER